MKQTRTLNVSWLWVAVGVLPGAIFALIFIFRTSWIFQGERRFTLFDDAMISMTFARTLSQGKGLVWYPGAPKVEGFSNPLWTLVMAVLHWVGMTASQVSLMIMVLGLACIGACAFLAALIVCQVYPRGKWSPVAAAFAIGMCYPLAFWSLRGMEVGLLAVFSLALISSCIRLVSDGSANVRRTVGWIVALVSLGLATRLDFLAITGVCLLWLAWALPRGRRARVVVPVGLTIIGSLVVMSALRFWYYGKLFPNTYTLKVESIGLITRLARGLVVDIKLIPVMLVLVLAAVVFFRTNEVKFKQVAVLLVSVGFISVCYSTYVGGDAWEMLPNRYVMPLVLVSLVAGVLALELTFSQVVVLSKSFVAVAILTFVASLVGLSMCAVVFWPDFAVARYFDVRFLKVGVAGGLMFVLGLLVGIWRSSNRRVWLVGIASGVLAIMFVSSGPSAYAWIWNKGEAVVLDQRETERGILLKQVTTPQARIAVSFAGAPIYYSERRGIDLLGKVDPVIAAGKPASPFFPGHNKWDYQHSIVQLKPDVIASYATGHLPKPSEKLVIDNEFELACFVSLSDTKDVLVRKQSTSVIYKAGILERGKKLGQFGDC